MTTVHPERAESANSAPRTSNFTQKIIVWLSEKKGQQQEICALLRAILYHKNFYTYTIYIQFL
jgi:hypothetical protein